MKKKGGDNQKEDVRLLDARVVLTVIICVFAGMLLVLCLIFFGMQVERKALTSGETKQTNSDVDIIGVSFESMNIPYWPDGNTEETSLLYNLTGNKEADHYVIKTKAEYDTVLNRVNNANLKLAEKGIKIASSGSLQVDEDYFRSGSIILFSVASNGLRNGYVSSITRNEKYALTAEVRYAWGIETDAYVGMAIFVKVPNIQTKDITVNYGAAMYADPK